MKKKLISLVLVAVMAASVIAGCGSKSTDDSKESTAASTETSEKKTTIKVGCRSDGVEKLEVFKKRFEDMGYKMEIVSFEDSIQPNVALSEGSIDTNWFQHIPYLNAYNAENGTDLVMVEPYMDYPLFAMYSSKHDTIEDLQDGAKIALCNDASNQARGLKMLEAQGLIKLDDSVETPTIYDVKENPHNFEFIEAEMTAIANAEDDYDAICLAAAHMATAGKDATKFLCQSDDGEDYALGFVVQPKDKDAEWVQDLIKAAQCDEMKEYDKVQKQGTMVPLW